MSVTKRLQRCGYCRHEVQGVGMPHEGVLYCSRSCRELGISARSKKARGWGWLSVLIFFIAGLTFTPRPAWAQNPGHAEHHDTYKDWVQSNGFSSCCNGDDPKTGVKGDCRPALAYQDPDDELWRVLIRGEWIEVPPAAIRDYHTPDGNSHVCETVRNGIMCFVRGKPKA